MNADLYPESAGETETSENETLGTNQRILVVDDEASMRDYAVEALAYGGYQSHSVNSGQAAIQALRDEHYDMVLTDFNMPNGSGGDLIIKMHAEGFTMPVIMMTGAALTKELLTLTKMLHVGTILQKPFRIDELVTNVQRLLRPVRNIPMHHEMSAGVGSSASEPREMR
jgi:DNA-binding NtrC family response regulator